MLVRPTKAHEADALGYIQEHRAVGEAHLHGASSLEKKPTYDDWLLHLERQSHADTVEPGWVPSTTLFAVGKTDGRIVGVIDIRHHLNDFLASYGGHIGYGVRPCERRKGYAAEMLRLGLQTCKTLGLERVMLTCNKDNIASAKTIIGQGGILEREHVHTDGETIQIYWITL